MTKKEKEFLKALILEVADLSDIIASKSSLKVSDLFKEDDPLQVIADLIHQVDDLKIYSRYMVFDHEACVRELATLTEIIKNSDKGK